MPVIEGPIVDFVHSLGGTVYGENAPVVRPAELQVAETAGTTLVRVATSRPSANLPTAQEAK
jgi:hypothetical protein